ncbi:MAG: hypothetical protein JKX92_14635 [Porticoccaceae bacterium]|nr:hypothetical protein [Porticoccaceae bacterium]
MFRREGEEERILLFWWVKTRTNLWVSHYAEDTAERTQFFKDNEHLIAGTMLVSVFAYLESTLGENWIDRCGGNQTKELKCLKLVRDAFVHTNNHIRDLGIYKNNPALEYELRSFIKELSEGNIRDDKGNIYPTYISLSEDGVVSLNGQAIQVFAAIGKAVCH